MDVPWPWAMTLLMVTLRMMPAAGSFAYVRPSSSLRRLMLKWMGSPSPHQNQSNRRVSMVTFAITTSSTMPPSKTIKARPRLELVMTTLLITTWRTALLLPSQNLIALDDDDRRLLVTVTFSVGTTGPPALVE